MRIIMSNWISIYKALPILNSEVLCLTKNNEILMLVFSKKMICFLGTNVGEIRNDVTHWMPIILGGV